MKKKIIKKSNKNPLDPKKKRLIWFIISISLVVIGIGTLFIPPVFSKVKQVKTQIVSSIELHKVKEPVKDRTLRPIEKPISEPVSMSPVKIEQAQSIFDRIMDSFDKIIGSGMSLVGLLIAIKQYMAHSKDKRKSKDST